MAAFAGQRPPAAAGTGGGAFPTAGDQPATDDESIDPLLPPVSVEIQGIIYIYNPPDKSKLGTGTAGGKVASDEAAPATAPTPSRTGGRP